MNGYPNIQNIFYILKISIIFSFKINKYFKNTYKPNYQKEPDYQNILSKIFKII